MAAIKKLCLPLSLCCDVGAPTSVLSFSRLPAGGWSPGTNEIIFDDFPIPYMIVICDVYDIVQYSVAYYCRIVYIQIYCILMKNHWEIFPKLCKWKRSLGHQAMTFALAPLTVIGPAWRSNGSFPNPFTGLFRFNRTKYPTKLGEWPSGHTNLPCPCFKSSCQK